MKRIELTVGHETATHMANYSALVEVAALALGGGQKGKQDFDEDLSKLSPEQFINRMSALTST